MRNMKALSLFKTMANVKVFADKQMHRWMDGSKSMSLIYRCGGCPSLPTLPGYLHFLLFSKHLSTVFFVRALITIMFYIDLL